MLKARGFYYHCQHNKILFELEIRSFLLVLLLLPLCWRLLSATEEYRFLRCSLFLLLLLHCCFHDRKENLNSQILLGWGIFAPLHYGQVKFGEGFFDNFSFCLLELLNSAMKLLNSAMRWNYLNYHVQIDLRRAKQNSGSVIFFCDYL